MKEELSNDLAKEIIMILPYLDKSLLEQISNELLDKINTLAADSNKEIYIDINKKLSEQAISEECKDFISFLYYQSIQDKDGLNIFWELNEN